MKNQSKFREEERKLTAIMFTDIQGFTRLMAKDETTTIRMLEEQTQIIKDLINQYKGRLVKTIGDAVMADFKSAVNAVRCAVEIQKEIRKYNENRPDVQKLQVRIGIHIGDVVIRGEDIYGDGVNVASRIEALAEPDSICISTDVYNKIKNLPDITTVSLGLRKLKNVEEPLKVYKVVPEGALPTKAVRKPYRRKGVQKTLIPVFTVVVLGIVFLLVRTSFFQEAVARGQRTVAVMPFKNLTGESSFEYLCEAIPNLLITSLEQSKYLSIMTWERMHDLLKAMGKEDVKSIDDDLGYELCRMDRIDAIVLGSFTKAGDMFATDVKVYDVDTKELLQTTSSRGQGVASILKRQIDELSREISRGVGLSERKIKATQTRIADVTTASMGAYNYFLRGRDDYDKFYYDDARRFLEKAVELDPTFAVAHLYLAQTYGVLGYTTVEKQFYENAKIFSEKATDKERLYIEAAYAQAIEREPEKRINILKQIAKKYPKEKRVHLYLAGYYDDQKSFYEAIEEWNKALELDPNYGPAINGIAYTYANIGDFEKAIEYFQKYASVSPGDANPFDSMAEIYFRMGRLDKAIAKYKEALEVKPAFGADWRIAYIYALKEDYSEAIKWVDQYIAKATSQGIKADGYRWKGFYNYWLGNLDQALSNLGKAEELAIEIGNEPLKSGIDWTKGWIYYERGEFELGLNYYKSWFDFAIRNYPPYIPYYTANLSFYLGLLDLKGEDINSARARLAEIKSLLPEINLAVKHWIIFYYDLLYEEVLLAADSVSKAIATYEQEAPLEIPGMSSGIMAIYNMPFLRDILARAYQQKGDLDKAITEYKRLITFDPDNKDRRLIHPKYHYRLAKLYEERGSSTKAIKQYEKFLEIWKDADPDLPEVKNAKIRLARLKEPS